MMTPVDGNIMHRKRNEKREKYNSTGRIKKLPYDQDQLYSQISGLNYADIFTVPFRNSQNLTPSMISSSSIRANTKWNTAKEQLSQLYDSQKDNPIDRYLFMLDIVRYGDGDGYLQR